MKLYEAGPSYSLEEWKGSGGHCLAIVYWRTHFRRPKCKSLWKHVRKNNLRRWRIGEYILRTIVGKTILGESFFLFHSFEICSPTSTVWVLMELMELWPSMGVWNAFQFLLNASSGDHHGGLRGEKTWNLKECDQWTGTIFCDSPTVEMKLDI